MRVAQEPLLNGNKKGTMKHGENKDIHFSLEPGAYAFTGSLIGLGKLKIALSIVVLLLSVQRITISAL